jgi:putative ABC transport system permease protein
MMENMLKDIRYGIRLLLRKPGFTFVVALALALGIGANTAIFSVVNAVVLNPLPYEEPEKLVWIWGTNPSNDIDKETASLPDFLDWRSQSESFVDMMAFARSGAVLTGANDEPERVASFVVTPQFFSVLGAEPFKGRGFTDEESKQGNNRVVVLSQSLWERRFSADEGVLGQAITINGMPHTVVGVMPRDFKNPRPEDRVPIELWVPLVTDPTQDGRSSDYLRVVARLKVGVSIVQARAEMQTIAARLEQQYPNTNRGWGTLVISLHERVVGDVEKSLWLVMGVVGLLLIIACANVANLLLARATARQQELALRTALGAGRGRLIKQLLTESVLLSLLGAALGTLLAVWGIELLVALNPGNIPRLDEVRLNGRVFGFTFGLSLLTGVVFGLLPALQATNPNLSEVLKEGARSSTGGTRSGRMRNVLVVAEIALALVMLIGTGLMIKSFLRLQNVDPGFNPSRILTAEFLMPRSKYPEGPQLSAFYDRVLERVGSLPGVESAGFITMLPLGGGENFAALTIEGRVQDPNDKVMDAQYYTVSPSYFAAMGVGFVSGSNFTSANNPNTPLVTIINQEMARRYWPDEDPIGKRINLGDPATSPWRTIIGVVKDVKHTALDNPPYPQMYVSTTQVPRRALTLVARTSSDPLALAPALRGEVLAIDSDQPLYNMRTMERLLADSISRPRFNMMLITVFGAIGLILASLGIYGVMAYSVTQRTHEIGVRMALGAKPRDILRLVVGQGLLLTTVGTAIGVGLGLGFWLTLARLIPNLFYDVEATDPVTLIAITLTLSCMALLASYIPARRAMKVDPMVALRYE